MFFWIINVLEDDEISQKFGKVMCYLTLANVCWTSAIWQQLTLSQCLVKCSFNKAWLIDEK